MANGSWLAEWWMPSGRDQLCEVAMPLTKPNQDLRRDLQGLASDLKWSAVDLARIAERADNA